MPLFYIGYGIVLILSLFNVINFSDKVARFLFLASGVLLFLGMFFPYIQFGNVVINIIQLLFIYLLISIFVYYLNFTITDFLILIISASLYHLFLKSGYDGFFSNNFIMIFTLLIIVVLSKANLLKLFQLLFVDGFVLYLLILLFEYSNFGFVFVSFDELFIILLYFILIEFIFYSLININNSRWFYEKKFNFGLNGFNNFYRL